MSRPRVPVSGGSSFPSTRACSRQNGSDSGRHNRNRRAPANSRADMPGTFKNQGPVFDDVGVEIMLAKAPGEGGFPNLAGAADKNHLAVPAQMIFDDGVINARLKHVTIISMACF